MAASIGSANNFTIPEFEKVDFEGLNKNGFHSCLMNELVGQNLYCRNCSTAKS